MGAVLFVLALGLVLRLILAYALPGSGFKVDLGAFRFWADYLATHGPWGFYEQDFLHDYLPGYMYVSWVVGVVGHAMGGIGDLIKVPPILADLAIGWLVGAMVLELGARGRFAVLAAFVAVMNPISWLDSVVWGQADSFGVVFLLLALRSLWRDQPERSAVYTVIAALIKPQLGILVPLVAVVTIRRALWPDGGYGDAERTGRPMRIVTTALAGLATAVIVPIPFGLTPIGLIQQLLSTGGTYPYLTVNAYNPWALVAGDTGSSLANSGLWPCDIALGLERCGSGVATFGSVPAIAVGTGLLVLGFLSVLAFVARRPDRLTILVGLAVLALAFFVLPTRVHERYGFPFFALAAIAAAVSWRWRIAYVALSVATFLNMYVVLTTLYGDNPNIRDWLGIGSAIRSEAGVVVIALVHAVGFGWAFLQLRDRAADRLADDLAAASGDADDWFDEPLDEVRPDGPDGRPIDASSAPSLVPAGMPAATPAPSVVTAPAVTMPTWSARVGIAELGLVAWIRDRWSDRAMRPDRSASLAGESGGRLDRLDLWIVVVLVVGALTLRMFRLEEPYQMHFDEVYHARTATEFLQDWRYGEEHDIYEWTHPHLAKYAMALGIMAWGADHVEATSDLGVPVVAAAIEPRRADPSAPGGRAGERLYVATGSEVRAYDLRSRALIATIPAPGVSSLAVDPDGLGLVLGFDDGRVATLDPASITADATATAAPAALGRVDGAVRQLYLTNDGTGVVVGHGDHLDILDRTDGTVVGSANLKGIADIADGGSGEALSAAPTDVPDPSAAASVLAEILGGNASDFAAKLATDAETVVLGSPGVNDVRKKVDAAIDDGRLAGISVVDVPRIAVATADGVTFLDAATGAVIVALRLDGGAHGLAEVDLDGSKLYVSSGTAAKPTYHVIATGGDDAKNGPSDRGSHPMPGLGSRIIYDDASQMIHILGRAPGASPSGPWTVYVVEPHGNAVYADARLPDGFTPAAWAGDIAADYPATDRQQILVMDRAGAAASIDIGSHEFSWRVPGVIAGAVMLACLYLLTRILFRRRLVAGLVGVLVLADGMTFVQSRIGMNDAYVGVFIIAAYTLFAAIWTGWWRARWAFWVGMPIVGFLLGLALASKWVALYAIGGLGLLILARSALGRCLIILALIGITTVLGYMGISVPAGSGFGNLTFLLMMIGFTLLAVVVSIWHPIAWTDDEARIAIGAPTALGAVIALGAFATQRIDKVYAIGPLAVTPLKLAVALGLASVAIYVLFVLAGRFGFGPLAAPPGPDDPARLLPPPDAPPDGWLRPGKWIGLPVVWAIISLLAIPLAVYVVSYIPWAMIEGHRLFDGWPAGHDGQTLLQLTGQMYGYHNGLTSPHPASSPWWAWLFDLKPVWFYQDGLAGGTSAALYDAGNVVIWWMGVPALLFVSVMAFRRRSPALALIAIGFAAQWIPWARIDRAAFQYHFYTALPFMIMALAYFLAELWHGAARRTWQLARLAGAVFVILPAALWLFSRPVCAVVGVLNVNPGSAACPAVIPEFLLTARTGVLAVVAGVGLFFLVRAVLALTTARDDRDPDGAGAAYRSLAITGAVVVAGVVGASFVPDLELLRLRSIPVEPIVLLAAIPLVYIAMGVFSARDPRRFVTGYLTVAISWFVILYPNIAAVPVPAALVPAYQGILPTYLYAFQFPVSQIDRNQTTPLFTPTLALLGIAILATCVVVAYSAWTWRLSVAAASVDVGEEPEVFARTGGA